MLCQGELCTVMLLVKAIQRLWGGLFVCYEWPSVQGKHCHEKKASARGQSSSQRGLRLVALGGGDWQRKSSGCDRKTGTKYVLLNYCYGLYVGDSRGIILWLRTLWTLFDIKPTVDRYSVSHKRLSEELKGLQEGVNRGKVPTEWPLAMTGPSVSSHSTAELNNIWEKWGLKWKHNLPIIVTAHFVPHRS